MADLAEIAQSGIDPVSGSPLSAEKRKELFRRSQISSSGIFGGGRAGTLVPVNKGPDPQTLAIVRTNTNTITSFQIQINNLTKQNNEVLLNLGKINSLQQQINILQVSVIDLGNNLQQIANLIVNDSALEQQKERLSQEQEKRLAEIGLRQGKEKQLESKIREALVWPIKQIGNKVQSAFGSLMSFMWQLLGGWLTMQGLDTLKALASGDSKKLDDIKKNVINSLLVVGGILTVLSAGIFRVVGTITKLTFRLGKFILSNTIGRLFSGLWNLGKKVLGLEAKTATAAGARGAAAVTMGAGTAAEVANAGKAGVKSENWFMKLLGMGGKPEAKAGAELGVKAFGKTTANVGSRAIPFLGAGISAKFAWDDLMKGNYGGAALNTLSGVADLTGVGAPLALGLAGGAVAYDYNWEKEQEENKNKNTKPKAQVNPQNSAVGNKPKTPEISSTVQTSSSSNNLQIAPAQVQKVPTSLINIPPEPEAKPNIVYASSGGSNAQSSQPSSSGSATNVPLFSSSNPDNFYALYSQVNYNVIM